MPTLARRPRQQPTGEPPIRLLIVDDSTVARAVLSRIVSSNPGFEVAAMAGSPAEALDALRTVTVDIILLDVEMPGGNGIEALPDIIRAGRGARVLIVSSMAEEGAEVTVRALAAGAADTLPKPGAGNFAGRFSEVLADRLRRLGRAEHGEAQVDSPAETEHFPLRAMPEARLGCVALGASTGGLPALIAFFSGLKQKIGAPILVTQHLPTIFMPYFARQLESASGRKAHVVEDGEMLTNDVIHIAPGDAHLCVERHGAETRVRLERRKVPSGCLPSVDPMLESVAETYGSTGVGVILSGMGRDGLLGGRLVVAAGGAMLAQDRATSPIWGMPRVVAEEGLASAVLPPADLARRIGLYAKRPGK